MIASAAAMPHIERLRHIGDSLRAVVAQTAPALIAIERVFINSNRGSSLLLSEARGAALLVLADSRVPVVEISALQIKQSVTGRGRASKQQVAEMVQRLLGVTVAGMPSDCTDALACALAAAPQLQRRPVAPRRVSSRRRLTRLVARRMS